MLRLISAAKSALLTLLTIVLISNVGAQGENYRSWVNDLTPISELDWSYERARHLLERAGFGGTPEEISRLALLTPTQAVKSLVHFDKSGQNINFFESIYIS